MYRYIIKRLVLMIPVILGVSLVVFGILALTPGDPASIILGSGATQAEMDALNHELGYDKPVVVRYANWVFDALRGDLGTSYMTKQPIASTVFGKIPISLTIAFNAILCAAMIGIPVGILSAVKQDSLLDTLPTSLSIFLASVPPFWLGMMLMLIFAVKLGWFPTSGIETWQSYILPMLTLGIPYSAQQMRFTRSSMLETIRQDYIRTARAKGASEKIVIIRHALTNALLPVITVLGMNFSGMLGGAVIAETVFAMPGVGQYIVQAIRQKDDPVVLSCTLMLATLNCLIMLLVDIIYAFVDPRIKARFASKKG